MTAFDDPTDIRRLGDALNRAIAGCAPALRDAIALVSAGDLSRMSWFEKDGKGRLDLKPAAASSHSSMRCQGFLARHAPLFAAIDAALPPRGPRAFVTLEIHVLREQDAPATAKLITTLVDRALAPTANSNEDASTQATSFTITDDGITDPDRLARGLAAAAALPGVTGSLSWRFETLCYEPAVMLDVIPRAETVDDAAARVLEHHALVGLICGITNPHVTIEKIALPPNAAHAAVDSGMSRSPALAAQCHVACR